MPKQKYMLAHMTWKEVETAFATNPVVLVPLGSMEEHGPHSIVGDFIAADEAAKAIAQKSGACCTPVIPFGFSEYFRGFPGTISLSPAAFTAVLSDICTSLIEHGVKKILIVNGHGGNIPLIEVYGRELRRTKGVMLGKFDLWQVMTNDMKKEFYGDKIAASMGHGGEPVTSVMHYLRPDEMRMDFVKGVPSDRIKIWEGFSLDHLNRTNVAGYDGTIYFNMEELTLRGCLADPEVGNAEFGKKIFERMVEVGCAFVEKMNAASMQVEPRE